MPQASINVFKNDCQGKQLDDETSASCYAKVVVKSLHDTRRAMIRNAKRYITLIL
jgi:hypothetical protein